MKLILLRIFLVLNIIICQALYSQSTHRLVYRFVEGRTLPIIHNYSQEIIYELSGKETKTKNQKVFHLRILIDEIKTDGAILIFTYDSLKHKIITPTENDVPFENIPIKLREKIFITDQGKIVSEEKVDSENINDSGWLLTEFEKLKLPIFPDEPIWVGDTWTYSKTDSLSQPEGKGIITVDYLCRFVGKEKIFEKDFLKIVISGKVNMVTNSYDRGMQLIVEGFGKLDGFFYFDEHESLVVYYEVNSTIDANMAIIGGPQTIIPITQISKSSWKLIE